MLANVGPQCGTWLSEQRRCSRLWIMQDEEIKWGIPTVVSVDVNSFSSWLKMHCTKLQNHQFRFQSCHYRIMKKKTQTLQMFEGRWGSQTITGCVRSTTQMGDWVPSRPQTDDICTELIEIDPISQRNKQTCPWSLGLTAQCPQHECTLLSPMDIPGSGSPWWLITIFPVPSTSFWPVVSVCLCLCDVISFWTDDKDDEAINSFEAQPWLLQQPL